VKKIDSTYKNVAYEHRNYWYKEIHPIVRSIIGVLVSITGIPLIGLGIAEGVAPGAVKNYWNTFFSTPETNTGKELTQVKEELKNLGSSPNKK
jgi:hypothetical protein